MNLVCVVWVPEERQLTLQKDERVVKVTIRKPVSSRALFQLACNHINSQLLSALTQPNWAWSHPYFLGDPTVGNGASRNSVGRILPLSQYWPGASARHKRALC